MTGNLRGLAVACLCLGVLLPACAGSTAHRTGPTPSATSLVPESPTALPRMDFPTFQALLAELRGKPVVVNVWASWCGPCIAEAPGLARVATAHAGRVQFIGVDILDELAPARAFIKKYGWPYPSVFDPSGGIRDGLGFFGQPITVVFDASGRRAFQYSGPISEKLLSAEVAKVL